MFDCDNSYVGENHKLRVIVHELHALRDRMSLRGLSDFDKEVENNERGSYLMQC